MKKLVCFALSLFLIVTAQSQKVYFIYLQSEAEQPFFVRLKEQVFNSHGSGFLTIPKLAEETHLLKVGFPNNQFPEQHFEVELKGKDRGFLLKNFGEKGWGLFDLQTLNVIMALPPAKNTEFTVEPRVVTPFTEVLSKAANDPSLKEVTIWTKAPEKTAEPQTAIVKENLPEKKPDPLIGTPVITAPVTVPVTETKTASAESQIKELPVDTLVTAWQEPLKDSVVVAVNEKTDTPQTQAPPVINTEKPVVTPEGIAVAITDEKKPAEISYEKSVVTRRSESSTTEGFGAVYVDRYADGHQDTIRILIPNPKTIAANTPVPFKEDQTTITGDVKVQEIPAVSAPFSSKSKFEPCKAVATEQEFISLRKKMGGLKEDEDKIRESRKAFRNKCFTTAQISNLGNLFRNEAGKFQFYEGAYPFVSDRENYSGLQKEFQDSYFVYRFKNLLAQ